MADAATAARRSRLALVLPGGGARSAYQVGVIKALAEIAPRQSPVPFPILCGTSAGAINAAALAAGAFHFREAAVSLERVWRNFRSDQVFRVDSLTMMRAGLHWLLALVTGGWLAKPPRSLLDNAPLRELLGCSIDLARVRQALDASVIEALSVTATGYWSARSVSFFERRGPVEHWTRVWREGQPAEISVDHLMASAAIPFLFPPVHMQGEYFGDGAMRQVTPLSPAVRLGAERMLVVGVRTSTRSGPVLPVPAAPTFGQIFGFMLDTLFMDGLYADLERLESINDLLSRLPACGEGQGPRGLRRIDAMVIVPRDDFGDIAARHAAEVPRALRVLLRTMGAHNPGGRKLLSYLLFESGYTRELIRLGYRDAMERRDALEAFISDEDVRSGEEHRAEAE